MKKFFNSNYLKLLLVGFTFLAAKCNKETDDFPKPEELSNQLICKINGVKWKSNEVSGGFFLISGTGHEYIRLVFANGREDITFFLNPPYTKPYYVFNKTTISYPNNIYPEDYVAFFRSYPDLTPEEEYITNSADTGSLDFISLDTTRSIIKARFTFTGRDRRTGKKLTITDGYFDYHL